MIAGPTDLRWLERKPEFVELEPPKQLYEDSLPLSDLLVAPTGATCCLRRVPDKAEVVTWDGLPTGEPVSWTGPPRIPLLELFGFDGEEVFGRTESTLLRMQNGAQETIHEAAMPIIRAALSPDRRHLLWIEQTQKGRLFTMSEEERIPCRLRTRESCMEALWLSNSVFVASLLHAERNAETGITFLLCHPNATPSMMLLETNTWILQLVERGEDSQFFVTGTRHNFPQSEFRSGPLPPKQIATWSIGLGNQAEPVCLANAGPFGGSLAVIDDTCFFADANHQTSTSSVLIAASPNRIRAAAVPGFLRNFAVSRRRLLFRSFGDRFGIYSLALEPLLP